MISRATRPHSFRTLALVIGAASIAGFLSEAMYRFSPAVGAGAILAPVVLALVAWRPMLGVYGAFLTIPLEATGLGVGGSNVTPAKAMLVITAVAVLPRLLLTFSREALHSAHLWFLCLLAVSLMGLTFAPDTHAVLVITGNGLAYLLISIYVSRMNRAELPRLLLVLVISGAVVGLVSLLTTGGQAVVPGGIDVTNRAQVGFDSPNVLAFYLLLTLGPCLAMLGEARTWPRRLTALSAAPLIVSGLVLTLSREAFLGAAVALLVLLGSSRFRRVAAMLTVALLVIVAINFGAVTSSPELAVVKERLSTINSVSGVTQNPRVVIWKATPRIIADHALLGVGEGNFPIISPSYNLLSYDLSPIDHAHDIFLTVAAELGLVGLAVFLAFLLSVVRAAWRALKHTRSRQTHALGVIASLLGVLVGSLSDYPQRTPTLLATMLIMVGLVVAFEHDALNVQQYDPTRG